MIDIINYEETDNTDDKVEQQYTCHELVYQDEELDFCEYQKEFMCVDDLKDKGFTYDDFKDYI